MGKKRMSEMAAGTFLSLDSIESLESELKYR